MFGGAGQHGRINRRGDGDGRIASHDRKRVFGQRHVEHAALEHARGGVVGAAERHHHQLHPHPVEFRAHPVLVALAERQQARQDGHRSGQTSDGQARPYRPAQQVLQGEKQHRNCFAWWLTVANPEQAVGLRATLQEYSRTGLCNAEIQNRRTGGKAIRSLAKTTVRQNCQSRCPKTPPNCAANRPKPRFPESCGTRAASKAGSADGSRRAGTTPKIACPASPSRAGNGTRFFGARPSG